MRTVMDLCGAWKFSLDNPKNATAAAYDDSDWDEVYVPHDWAITRPISENTPSGSGQGFYERWGIGWYRKDVDLSPEDGTRVRLEFDGVFHESDVFINGNHCGRKHYGYTPFTYDITDYVIAGRNVIAVRVDNSEEHQADRWYSGCGIYRPVKLTMTQADHIDPFGVRITPHDIGETPCSVTVSVSVSGDPAQNRSLSVTITDAEGMECGRDTVRVEGRTAAAEVALTNPNRWSADNPHLYTASVQLRVNNKTADWTDVRFGVRTVTLDKDTGLYINGENVTLKGVNLHHDLGVTGAAWNRALAERRLRKLKDIGCNAVRTSHNPPAAEFLDLCDEMGFWVIDEAFDKWKTMRYGLIFDSCWEEDIDAMVLRDCNHPCVFAWSVGNEIDDQGEPEMLETARHLVERVRELDPTRPVTFAQHPHAWPEEVSALPIAAKAQRTAAMADLVDFASLNYQEQWYDAHRGKKNDILIAGSETYMYFRGHGNSYASYRPVNPFFSVKEHPFVFGHFVWAGVDYLGEAVWPARGWPGCLMDTNGELREAGQLTRMLWEEKPAIFMAVHDPTERNQHGRYPWRARPLPDTGASVISQREF